MAEDPRRLLEQLREALRQVAETESQLGAKAFGLVPYEHRDAPSPPLPALPDGFTPLRAQTRGIQQALANDVTYIIGPPGTGKTATLAAIARPFIEQGLSVLIAAHTNIAVDNAIAKVAEFASGCPALHEGRLVRCGPAHLASLRQHPDIYPPNIARRRGHVLAERQAHLEAEGLRVTALLAEGQAAQERAARQWATKRERLVDHIADLRQALEPLQQREQKRLRQLERQLAKVQAERDAVRLREQTVTAALQRCQSDCDHQQHVVDTVRRELASASQRLADAQRMTRLGRFVRRIRIDELIVREQSLSENLAQGDRALTECQNAYGAAQQDQTAAHALWSALNARCSTLQADVDTPRKEREQITALQQRVQAVEARLRAREQAYADERGAIATQLRAWQNSLEQMHDELTNSEGQLANLERAVITDAQAVATTLSKLYMGTTLRDRVFDVVILDEVSIAPLPAVYLAASRARHKLIAIGDPKQLPPIVLADQHPLARQWLGRDLFAVAQVHHTTALTRFT